MKTSKKQVTTMMIVLALVLSAHSYAQKEILKSSVFVRVYNLDGEKINKGHVAFVGDTILGLHRNGNYVEINVHEIGTIKTKKSAGHNLFIGTATGAVAGAILGVATADTRSHLFGDIYIEYESLAITSYVLLGVVAGAAGGGISIAFKDSETYVLNGDLEKWHVFKALIENHF